MEKNNAGLDRLCMVYEKLNDEEKEKVIRLAEGLLNAQKTMKDERLPANGNTELKGDKK